MTDPNLPIQVCPPGYAPRPGQPIRIGEFVAGPQYFQYPGGHMPIAGTQWRITTTDATDTRTPVWAIVLGIVLALFTCFLSMLFLLVKEEHVGGFVTVEVMYGNSMLSTRASVRDHIELHWMRNAVEQAQAWSFTGMSR